MPQYAVKGKLGPDHLNEPDKRVDDYDIFSDGGYLGDASSKELSHRRCVVRKLSSRQKLSRKPTAKLMNFKEITKFWKLIANKFVSLTKIV